MKNYKLSRLNRLIEKGQQQLLIGGLKGIEKESLRISNKGLIAQTPHPILLGSPLAHPHITTDYSEALLEFITPPFADIRESMTFLDNIHQFVNANLDNELLLATSMPCGINGDESIPIAYYGVSNVGKMKNIYRRGLSYRYGRTMQAIAGIHFNYSVPEALWPVLQKLDSDHQDLMDYKADAYFALTRNFQRNGWLILYLFGASPAICKSFFKSRPELMRDFEAFDTNTLYLPYATSLRMSDIGYKSNNQANLNIDYNSLSGYVASLIKAIETPYPEYEKIGIKKDGEYRQLNSNILQIENEYYSTIRPKQVANSCEKPTLALKRRGVQYVEVRSIDLDLFNPLGIDLNRAYFMEAFLLTCLLDNSPKSGPKEHATNNENQLLVAHQGRKPGLQLQRSNESISLQNWANEIFDAMQAVCEILDGGNPTKPYTEALGQQRKLIANPKLTPSAQILASLKQNNQAFASFALEISSQHQAFFKNRKLSDQQTEMFNKLTKESHFKQKEIEAYDELSFSEFLECYFAQTCNESLNC